MPVISLKGVSKRYRIFPSRRAQLKEALSFGRKKYGHDFWALQDINLEVEPGTTLGVLGRNGAGKSTLLNIIAGIRQPTSGTVEVNGRMVALSGLGVGFNPEFTGRENVMLNGLILGIERQELVERFDDIAAFADIGEFMDQPLKTYSSGMRSRLGFAVAINVEPDVLILDETLAAGDAVTKEAALQKMYELRDSGTTILFVSHSMGMVKDFCTEAVLLHKGRVMATGETTEVIDQYQDLVSSIRTQRKERRTDGGQPQDQITASNEETPGDSTSRKDVTFKEDPAFERRVAHLRSGTGKARIRGVELLDGRLRPVEALRSGSTVTVRVYLEYLEAVKGSELVIALHQREEPEQTQSPFYGPNLGYVLDLYESYKEDPESVDERTQKFFESWNPPPADANGRAPAVAGKLLSASTARKGVPLKEMEKGERVIVDFAFEVPLKRGFYNISASARASGEDLYLDNIDVARTFRIRRPRDRSRSWGLMRLPTEIKVHTPAEERRGWSA
jgi:ABC-type polysaccharide/polyol phosphate transport system ATPase subunit